MNTAITHRSSRVRSSFRCPIRLIRSSVSTGLLSSGSGLLIVVHQRSLEMRFVRLDPFLVDLRLRFEVRLRVGWQHFLRVAVDSGGYRARLPYRVTRRQLRRFDSGDGALRLDLPLEVKVHLVELALHDASHLVGLPAELAHEFANPARQLGKLVRA